MITILYVFALKAIKTRIEIKRFQKSDDKIVDAIGRHPWPPLTGKLHIQSQSRLQDMHPIRVSHPRAALFVIIVAMRFKREPKDFNFFIFCLTITQFKILTLLDIDSEKRRENGL